MNLYYELGQRDTVTARLVSEISMDLHGRIFNWFTKNGYSYGITNYLHIQQINCDFLF